MNNPQYIYLGAHLVSDNVNHHNEISITYVRDLFNDVTNNGWSLNIYDENPQKVILTLDDGRCFSNNFVSLLDEFSATAIFFICTKNFLERYPEGSEYMSLTEENRNYILQKHIVGSHTANHNDLSVINNRETQETIIKESFDKFREIYGFSPECFSYPWGKYNMDTLRILRDNGIKYAFLAAPGKGVTSDYLIPRLFLEPLRPEDFNLKTILRLHNNYIKSLKLFIRKIHLNFALR